MKYWVFSIGFFILISCSSKKENTFQKRLDSLSAMLRSTDSVFSSIDWDKVIAMEAAINIDISSIDVSSKKMKNEKKEVLENYKNLLLFGKDSDENPVNSFSQSQVKNFLRKQIDYSKSQIENLKSDTYAENLKDDKIKEYINTEHKAIANLHTFTNQKSNVYQYHIAQFENLKPMVDEIIGNSK